MLQKVSAPFCAAVIQAEISSLLVFHCYQCRCAGKNRLFSDPWERLSLCRLQGDLAAGEMIHGVEDVDPQRRQQLIHLLDIDLQWRLNRISDGQRRRVQICMGLLKPYKVMPSFCDRSVSATCL